MKGVLGYGLVLSHCMAMMMLGSHWGAVPHACSPITADSVSPTWEKHMDKKKNILCGLTALLAHLMHWILDKNKLA